MTVAVKMAQLDVVKFLYNHKLLEPSCKFIFSAAEHGHLDIVKWLHTMEPICSTSVIVFAAKGGDLEIVKWLHYSIISESQGQSRRLSHHKYGSKRSIDEAAANGHLAVVQWLHNHRLDECSVLAMDNAATWGRIDVVQWLHANRSDGCTFDALCQLVYAGHLAMAQWVYEHRKECCDWEANGTRMMDNAARRGYINVIKWLHEMSARGSKLAVDAAAEFGHLEVGKFLLENRIEGCTMAAISGAARSGHLKTLRYLIENVLARYADPLTQQAATDEFFYSIDSDESAINQATQFGRIHIVKYLYENYQQRCGEDEVAQARRRALCSGGVSHEK